ncbi:membrane protein [Corynebacterium phocae]|uniref:Membrane protein n=1 Tax=Corynebacterium phocae TaxID=161895 RepID=A0A1L7D5N7_9CORY|nr:hypothetical protein [Corynebacterium phocae]APT93313.1 membrane protein [Corynebacterium phocae]
MTTPAQSTGTTPHASDLATDAAGDRDAHAHQDQWLDEVSEPAQPIFDRATHRALMWFAGPARLMRRGYNFITTTPGKMTTMMVLLTVTIAAAGLSMANFSSARHERLDVLLSSTEPMNNAAHNLYTSLSLADTVASTTFVQAGDTPEISRQLYNDSIDRAAAAATQAVLGTDESDTHIRSLVGLIQRRLPVYTGMVEQARANHRSGNAVAVTYMTNASALMRDDILPAAGELFQLTSAKVATQERELTTPQWIPITGFLAAVGLLLVAQWWLWRLTRRRFNRGFLTGTALMLVALVWVVIANVLTWASGGQRFDTAAAPWEQLTNSQIAAQQARTAETLLLVNRQTPDSVSDEFTGMASAVNQALDSFTNAEHKEPRHQETVDSARAALAEWSVAHRLMVENLAAGNYDAAIYQATAVNPPEEIPTSAPAFSQLNNSLTQLIATTREVMRTYINDSLTVNRALGGAVGFLTIAAIFAIWVGIRPRLQEYL